jgi:uncharacterized membrane protein YjgN (DUF898 family)
MNVPAVSRDDDSGGDGAPGEARPRAATEADADPAPALAAADAADAPGAGAAGAADTTAAAPPQVAQPSRSRLQFTGSGAEYFRIWVVNLLLTLATVGAYSAWAKVRKTRYFCQNTRLDGHAFDYHGAPLAILRGRMLAVVLLAAYTWSFDISRTVGLATIAVLCIAGPWLFMKAQQFRFRNTSWHGLRFGFDAATAAAYRTLLPLLLVWFSGTIAGALLAADVLLVTIGALTALLLPWMHHRLKQFQHAHVRYGGIRAAFRPAAGRFYVVYLKGTLLLLAVAASAGFLAAGLGAALTRLAVALGLGETTTNEAVPMIAAGAAGLLAYLLVWPYFAARLQQVVWGNTRLGPVAFETKIRAGPLAKLVVKSVLLSLLSAGLYWPFAAVALARYRIENMEVIAPEALADAVGGVTAATVAAGEGAADLFGLDVGL